MIDRTDKIILMIIVLITVFFIGAAIIVGLTTRETREVRCQQLGYQYFSSTRRRGICIDEKTNILYGLSQ